MRRQLLVSLAAAALLLVAAPMAQAETSCDPLSTGSVVPPTSMTTIEVVAPVGLLIDEVCIVTEGSLVPSHLMVDPLVPSLVLDGEGGAIIEYSASFVSAPEPSGEEAEVFVPPQPATAPLPEQGVPEGVNAGGGANIEDQRSVQPSALLGLALMALAAAAVQFVIARRHRDPVTHR